MVEEDKNGMVTRRGGQEVESRCKMDEDGNGGGKGTRNNQRRIERISNLGTGHA